PDLVDPARSARFAAAWAPRLLALYRSARAHSAHLSARLWSSFHAFEDQPVVRLAGAHTKCSIASMEHSFDSAASGPWGRMSLGLLLFLAKRKLLENRLGLCLLVLAVAFGA